MTIIVEPKDPDTPATYEIDVFQEFVDDARRSYEYSLNDISRGNRDTGFYYVCTKAGRTAKKFPQSGFPRRANEIVIDGSLEWTAKHPADVSPTIIQSVTWIVPTGLILDSQTEDNHLAKATFSGGTDGQDYDVTARIAPNTGTPRDVTITIPVRQR